ncbi:hypothetical protein ACTNB0_16790 [Lachnospiraceae bacterium HCP28S3_F9]
MINSRNEIIGLLKEYTVTQQEYVYQFWMPEVPEWNVERQVAYANGIVLGKFREDDSLTMQVLKEGVTNQALYSYYQPFYNKLIFTFPCKIKEVSA